MHSLVLGWVGGRSVTVGCMTGEFTVTLTGFRVGWGEVCDRGVYDR